MKKKKVDISMKNQQICCICENSVDSGLLCVDGHFACIECYKFYLSGKEKAYCIGRKCKHVIPLELLLKITENVDLVVESYAKNHKYYSCHGPDCKYYVLPKEKNNTSKIIKCKCGFVFCIHCGEPDHIPAQCEQVIKWKQNTLEEAENLKWLVENTRKCPKCLANTERNGGCNHMTCKTCHYEYCWLCFADWKGHNGTAWKCNVYDSNNDNSSLSNVPKSRVLMERYYHYYKRFEGHENAIKFASEYYQKVSNGQEKMREKYGIRWIDMQFLLPVSNKLIECRKFLKWSYCIAYYLQRDDPETIIFENIQAELESTVDYLTDKIENYKGEPIIEYQSDITRRLDYLETRRKKFIDYANKSVSNGTWKYEKDLDVFKIRYITTLTNSSTGN